MADMKEILRRLLEEVDKEEKDELLDSLKGKKLTGEELLEAIRGLPPEARKEVREALADVKEELEEEEEKKPKVRKAELTDEEKEEEEEEEKKPKTRTRPGRKSGRAYGWWVDDKGEVIPLDIARIYSGEDEPDTVELLPKDEEEEEEEEETA